MNSALLRDVPVGATVRLVCGACKLKQTLTAKKAERAHAVGPARPDVPPGQLVQPHDHQHEGYVGQVVSRKVKSYGRSAAAIEKAARGPFSETRRSVP